MLAPNNIFSPSSGADYDADAGHHAGDPLLTVEFAQAKQEG